MKKSKFLVIFTGCFTGWSFCWKWGGSPRLTFSSGEENVRWAHIFFSFPKMFFLTRRGGHHCITNAKTGNKWETARAYWQNCLRMFLVIFSTTWAVFWTFIFNKIAQNHPKCEVQLYSKVMTKPYKVAMKWN